MVAQRGKQEKEADVKIEESIYQQDNSADSLD